MRPRYLPLALLLLAGCHDDHECCAPMPPEFKVAVLDEDGSLVSGTRVTVEYSDPIVARDTGTVDGFAYFRPIPGPIHVVAAPPPGYAIADSSSTDTTVVMDSVGVYLAIVLKRTRR